MEGAALCRGQFHQSVGTVLPAQAEDREDQGRGRDCPEKDAEPPVHPGHVQDDEHEEDGEQAPGKDGMVHISKLANHRVNKVEDVVNIGDMMWVKVTDIDEKGRVNLSHKDAMREIAAKEANGERVK